MARGWTLAKLIADDMTVMAHCQNYCCHHRQVLDIKALSERFGPDAPAMYDDLVPRLKCTKCGGKQIGLTYPPNVAPSGNPYRLTAVRNQARAAQFICPSDCRPHRATAAAEGPA